MKDRPTFRVRPTSSTRGVRLRSTLWSELGTTPGELMGLRSTWIDFDDCTFPRIAEWLRVNSEKAMATHSSVLAWRIPGMVEPGGLLTMGSHRVGYG